MYTELDNKLIIELLVELIHLCFFGIVNLLIVFAYSHVKTHTLSAKIVDRMDDSTIVNPAATNIWIIVDNHLCYGSC